MRVVKFCPSTIVVSAAAQKKHWKSNSIKDAQGWLVKLLTETVRRNDGYKH